MSGAAPPEKSRVVLTLTATCLLAFAFFGDRRSDGRGRFRQQSGRRPRWKPRAPGRGRLDLDEWIVVRVRRTTSWDGSRPRNASLLSYSDGSRYTKADTRRDLNDVRGGHRRPDRERRATGLDVGHSQAALILDRMISFRRNASRGFGCYLTPTGHRSPSERPGTRRGRSGAPRRGSHRGASRGCSIVSDSRRTRSTPGRVRRTWAMSCLRATVGFTRMSVWALGDSVWLDSDWRRENETNLVSISDHVGAVEDLYALDRPRRFFAGDEIGDDEGSWRDALATTLRYTFAPWRP